MDSGTAISVGFGVFGAVGTILAILGFILQKRSKQAYENRRDYWEYREKLEIELARSKVKKAKEEERIAILETILKTGERRRDESNDKRG